MDTRVLHQHTLGAKFYITMKYVKDTIPTILWFLMHPITSKCEKVHIWNIISWSSLHLIGYALLSPVECFLHIPMAYCFGSGKTGTKWGIRDQCLTQWVPSQGPLCVPALFPRQCGHKNTTSSHTRLYIYANPDNASTKNCATHNSFQGCFLGNRLPRLSSFEIHATDESLWKP